MVRAEVVAAFPHATAGKQANFTGQLWALRSAIVPGDIIVMPMKTTKKIAVGICAHGYSYRSDEDDVTRRHTVGVDWKVTEVPRTVIRDDLLNTINGAMTIFQAAKNNAEARLRALIETGQDPGSQVASPLDE
ncbi:hypothetical protein [Phytoactinopolyspora halotolerans]|uniref:Uncharacterized protein n=1 Tax=Phytoactinopolyspora halotolerans TaxID=1981512 RepID=A0A6L9SHK9_9ACTN|nr:hypothetical protein [Phytoactinopolyspora halotolerans]NEE04617.1 hypothetical protein [Phytoactinopolyspora halotolerans]